MYTHTDIYVYESYTYNVEQAFQAMAKDIKQRVASQPSAAGGRPGGPTTLGAGRPVNQGGGCCK